MAWQRGIRKYALNLDKLDIAHFRDRTVMNRILSTSYIHFFRCNLWRDEKDSKSVKLDLFNLAK